METLDIKGFAVEAYIAGSGPPLLYLHAEQYVEQQGRISTPSQGSGG